jgi:hypothetical protein
MCNLPGTDRNNSLLRLLPTQILALGLIMGRGAHAQPNARDAASSDIGSGTTSDAFASESTSGASSTLEEGGPHAGGSSEPGPRCDTVGTRRMAMATEMAEYCICKLVAEETLVWVCYGPSPTAQRPQATCLYTTVNPGTGSGSCLVNWSNCSDGKIYGFNCVELVRRVRVRRARDLRGMRRWQQLGD